MDNEKPSIKAQKNGPLLVKELTKFTNSHNEPVETKKTLALCRCGASKTKPFCDGTHTSIGFSSKKNEKRVPDKKDTYKGKSITIHDNRGICSHAGFCTANLPGVFRMGTEPWIDPDGSDIEEIKRVIRMCPSGALSYSEKNIEVNDFGAEAEIHISFNGPYYVRGGVELKNETLGEDASQEHFTLCRCGKSGNKPRCDGAHWYAAFKDDEALTISAANRALGKTEVVWQKAAEVDELPKGAVKALQINNQQILLSFLNGKYGAIEAVCSHQGGPLSDSTIEEGVVRCPWHGHAFNPTIGKSEGGDSDLKTYEVEKRDDGIYIKVESPQKSSWTVSHVMAETMVNWGFKHVFGMVGHSNLGLAEAIRVQENKNNLRFIGVRHEGAAAFACSGYAKASGKPAACLTIAGPGATNLLTGLWDAKVDGAPVLALTGQIDNQFIGPGSFQEIDLQAAFNSVAAFSKTVIKESNFAELMSLAIKNALVKRDVSHLIFPDEVQTLDAGETGPGHPLGRLSDTKITPSDESVNLAMYRIFAAKRPVIIAGYGARDGMEAVIAFAEKLNAPVLTTFKAKGQISDLHPLGCGVLGRSGTPVSAWFMNQADLLIVFGASFAQHTGIDKNKPIIQVDFERMTLGKFHPVDTAIWGAIAITADLFSQKLSTEFHGTDFRDEIAERKKFWQEEKKRRMLKKSEKGLNSAFIFDTLSKIAPDNAIFSLDVGNNTYSFGRYFECKDQRVILSGYLGSIGFGFPAAMGAYMAQDERPVISVSGDGGFGQYMGEFNTAVRYGMNMTHILLNNNELGKISKEQRNGKFPVWQTGLSNPNFSNYAKECGGFGIRVKKKEALEEALKKAFAYEGPALVEIISDPEQI